MPNYNHDFYEHLGRMSRATAEFVVPLIQELLQPASVVDVGCGTGEWLAVCRARGIRDVFGIDGDWVPRAQLQIPPDTFMTRDVSRPFALARKFDLAVSLEVAEHLPAPAAEGFVKSLTNLAPAVLFSAAIPFQGGRHHVNEQWPDYWRALFGARGYALIDCLRRRLWEEPSVQPYIAQNVVLYVAPSLLAMSQRLRTEQARTENLPLRLVHPGVYQVPSVRRLLRLRRHARSRSSAQ